ncbi:MAG: N-acetylneuraminate synthase [Selenomonadales bacterium]|nr:N-acetylneuraminate synthase [Selenomonadales bacterium]
MDKVLIIAEAGVNHNGSLDNAKKMVDAAKNAGVDIVKYQTFDVDSMTSKNADMAEYQKENIGAVKSQKDMLLGLTLTKDEFRELSEYCVEKNIKFLSTPFDIDSIYFLNELGCDIWKIPSGEITNYPYLVEIAKTGKPIILSTGMCELAEVEAALNLLKENGAGEVSLLHCTTEYPTPYEDVNLKAMQTLKDKFGLMVGYSDHTKGIEVPIAAVAMGATIIEKHFTLDKNMEGPDHKASLEPDELKAMVDSIRNIEKALGNGVKKPANSEIKNIAIARKSIVAKSDIAEGEIFTEDNITTKRPGNGISPMKWNDVLGTKAIRAFGEDELIEI